MNRKKLILSSGAANIFEWYDYALFGHFAPLIGEQFFPGEDSKASLLHAFLVFAIGYFMRPIGGIFFGIIGDRFGRKVALSTSIICMAIPTAVIGILPTYNTIGILAPVLMIIVRMLQGLSMGGALTGSISFIIEHTSSKYRGFTGSVLMASICVGILLGSSASYFTKTLLTPEQFQSWGWRLPFLIGIFIFICGTYIKTYMDETPYFIEVKERGEIISSPLSIVLSSYWRDLIISIFINSTGSVIFYLHAIYLISYLKISKNFQYDKIDLLTNLCYILMTIVTLLVGWLSDQVERRKVFIGLNLLIIVFMSAGLMKMFEHNFTHIIIGQVILAFLAASYIAPEPALQAEMYPTNVRNTALSVSYNMATSIFGGTTPLIVELLVRNYGTVNASSYYVIACAILSIIALTFYKKRL